METVIFSFNQRLISFSYSTFLTQRSKEEQAVSCHERRTDRPGLLTMHGGTQITRYTRHPARPLHAYISHSLDFLDLEQTHLLVNAMSRQTPVRRPCCGDKALPFILPRYSTSGGNICQSTGQSWYDRLSGLPYFTGMWLVLSKACYSATTLIGP